MPAENAAHGLPTTRGGRNYRKAVRVPSRGRFASLVGITKGHCRERYTAHLGSP